jgi:ubiquitin C-terminal hydrolase
LYHCQPFREQIMALKLTPEKNPGMLYEVWNFFQDLEHQKKSQGSYNHKKLIAAIKKNNALFDNDEHHDAHEFVTWLLDQMHEQVPKEEGRSFVKDLFAGKI